MVQSNIKPRYKAIVAAVIEGVAQRRIPVGQKLPPQRELAHQLGIAIATVGRAYSELEQLGVVTSHVGRGTYISEIKPKYAATEPDAGQSIDMQTYRVPVADLPGLVSETLRAIAAEDAAGLLLENCPTQGDFSHREALAGWLSLSGISASPEQIIVTNGGQHAAMCALSTITHPGQTIATEELTDPRMKAVAGYLDRQLAAVKMDAHGMLPDALEAVCSGGHRISAIYCTPRNQNPTNAVLPYERRVAIAEIAERYDIPIIESDIYGTLRQEKEPPIFALAPHRTHFVTSLGRIAGPGMKVGCLVSPPESVLRSQSGVGMSTGASSRLQAEIAARWIRQGHVGRMMNWQQTDALRRVSLLSAYPTLARAVSLPTSPHIWLPLPEPWRSEEFVDTAAAHGIAIAPTHSFVVGRREVPHAVRIVIGAPDTLDTLKTGLDRLERILQNPPRPHGRSA
ncbi:PLP-dependent aminotransferase family protein [Pseudohoeflea suaedae]|uniref:aminotransferase-like domain-containing protein n=1 Tax=Pseudohoeflea suaedae TaxID=877384 RepID=UPI001304A202|nr:PLP-dependent aminotransferase family protein [Pseudohoeflea suaedae]